MQVSKVDADIAGEIPALFTLYPHRRLTRARFPNGDLETVQWGYASPTQWDVALPGECRGCRPSAVDEWLLPPAGSLRKPRFAYVDLTTANPTGAIKNDSAMGRYNAYGSGRGGLCDACSACMRSSINNFLGCASPWRSMSLSWVSPSSAELSAP